MSVREWKGYIVLEDGKIIGPSGRVVHGTLQSKGYLQTSTAGGKKILLHHIVAAAYHDFVDDGKSEIDHIDGNIINNHPGNLRVVTKSQHWVLDATRRRDANLKKYIESP